MDKELYKKLIEMISGYYPTTGMENNQIKEIVSNKINHLDGPSSFKSLCKDLESIEDVEDVSYLQFPNLKLYLQHIEDISTYRVYKNFAVCISLLCPYYTFFYEYDFRIKSKTGFLPISKIGFLDDDKLAIVRRQIDIQNVDSLIKSRFPHHSYVNHYLLLANSVDFGPTFGEPIKGNGRNSIFRYLFDSTIFNQEYP